MSERPVRTVSQVARAADVGDDRAAELLLILELMGLAEPHGSGYRRTRAAELQYPVLDEAEVRRRQVARRQANPEPGHCIVCAKPYSPSPRLRSGFCSRACGAELRAMREVA